MDPTPEFLALQQALAGRFSLEREIGRGGMGVVFLARDVALDRPVAIKLLPHGMSGDAELRDRFLREARTAAQLSHPNIVPIHLVEERDGLVFFVMAFIEGESVADRIRRTGAMPTGEVIRMVQEVAWALAYAHGRGVVHRDVKPDNVMIERASGRALLADFGIARRTGGVGPTTPGLILGSLQYMAPEQADADAAVDGRADIYALGVSAFLALTGRLPFDADKPAALIAAHMLEPAPPVATIAPNAPMKLAEVIDRCLAKDPSARWQTGEALADALNDIRETVRAMPPSIRAFWSAIEGVGHQYGLLVLIAMWVPLIVPDQMVTIYKLLGLIGLLPFVNVFVGVRAVAIAGYSHDDVVQAIRSERRASDRYTEYMRGEAGKALQQVKSRWGKVVLGLFGALEIGVGIGSLIETVTEKLNPWWKLIILIPTSLAMIWIGVEMLGYGLQIGPFKERVINFMIRNERRVAPLADAFWSSRFVGGLLAVGRWGIRWTTKQAPTVQHRPTEALLASAAAEVFAGLPSADRAQLTAVPDVVRKLEAHAAHLRERIGILEATMASVGDPAMGGARGKAIEDMRTAKDGAESQLRVAVEALENLRLDLLRLRAGVGSTADLSEAIEAACRLGTEIDYTLAGRQETTRILSTG